MNVSWYYAVQGTPTGPLSWDELRTAVASEKLGANDLIWTSSFGTEWRQATTMTGLFPPPPSTEPPMPPPLGTPSSEPTKEVPRIEILLAASELKSPFAQKIDGMPPDDNTPQKVICIASLKRAWHNTLILLFTTFSPRRWFFFALCLMLTMLSPPNPFAGLMVNDENSAAARQIKTLGLQEVTQSGLFQLKMLGDTTLKLENESLTSEKAIDQFGEAMRDTAIALSAWFEKGGHTMHLMLAALGTLFMYGIGAWFSARGNTMLLARLYRPDDVIFATWIEADKPAASLFRGMFVIRMLTFAAFLVAGTWSVMQLTSIPQDEAITQKLIVDIVTKLFLILLADRLLISYVRDFVTPYIVLEDSPFVKAFTIALRSTGFWFFRYLMLLVIAYIALAILLVLIGSFFGLRGQIATTIIFTSPLFGAVLTLPLHLLRRLWTLDIVFRTKPALRAAVPKARILRIRK